MGVLPMMNYSFQIDPKVWKAFRARCDKEGRKVIWVIKALLMHYIDHGLDNPEPPTTKKDK